MVVVKFFTVNFVVVGSFSRHTNTIQTINFHRRRPRQWCCHWIMPVFSFVFRGRALFPPSFGMMRKYFRIHMLRVSSTVLVNIIQSCFHCPTTFVERGFRTIFFNFPCPSDCWNGLRLVSQLRCITESGTVVILTNDNIRTNTPNWIPALGQHSKQGTPSIPQVLSPLSSKVLLQELSELYKNRGRILQFSR